MKQYLSILVLFAFFLMAIPSISFFTAPDTLKTSDSLADSSSESSSTAEVISNADSSSTADTKKDSFLVLDTSAGQVLTVSAEDYIVGAVCAEMPASFEPEALKAQAVAAHTYAVRQRERELKTPTAELKGAYFSNDSSKYQAFFTADQMKEFYGAKYEENYKKVSDAVKDVLDEILVYKGEPIVAAFHSMSGGVTESAEVVWGTAFDYLVPVKSEEDVDAPDFLEETVLTATELSARLTAKYADMKLPEDKSAWLTITERSASGTITKLSAGGIEITGIDLRTLLSLRSANFDISYAPDTDKFTITTKGYGHGVGLSQYGANAMAAAGKTYKEILTHYYKGAEVVSEA